MKSGSCLVSALTGAVTETIENMAFAEAVLQGRTNTLPVPGKGDRTVWLRVLSPVKGILFMTLSGELLKTLMENIYGMYGDGDPGETGRDTMAEILNTMAGRFMSLLTGPDRNFEIGLPEPEPHPGVSEKLPAPTCVFDVDGGKLTLSFISNGNN